MKGRSRPLRDEEPERAGTLSLISVEHRAGTVRDTAGGALCPVGG